MKRFVILVALGSFLLVIARYFYLNFSPLNLDKIQSLIVDSNIRPGDWESLDGTIINLINSHRILDFLSPNAFIGFFTALVGGVLIFIAIHLLIDKFFFKNYFEKASVFDATRRGVIIGIVISVIFYLRLSGYDFQTQLLVTILAIALEILFFMYIKPVLKRNYLKMVDFNKKVTQEIKKDK